MLLAIVVVVWIVAGWVHWREFRTLKWWAIAAALYVAWALFLAYVPGHADFAWPWMFIDGPLNFGWAVFGVWPFCLKSWRAGRPQREHLRAQVRFLFNAYRQYRKQIKEMQ